MIEKMEKIIVSISKKESKSVKNQRSQCRTTHKRQDC